jgi:hypothetical protein
MEDLTVQTLDRSHTAGGVIIDDGQLAQLAYHVRWSAALAAEGHPTIAAQHAIMADALLDVLGGEALRSAGSALDLPEVIAQHSDAATAQRAAAMELGFQFVSHFASDGRYDLADLYMETTRRLASMT